MAASSEVGTIFSAPMVRSLLDGTKTAARFLAKEPAWAIPGTLEGDEYGLEACSRRSGCLAEVTAPYVVGQRLWARETWAAWFRDDVAGQFDWKLTPKAHRTHENCTGIAYRATTGDELSVERWVTPLFMPRWASRITLEVTDVRLERLHAITEEDARREGVGSVFDRMSCIGREQPLIGTRQTFGEVPFRASFACYWDDLYADSASWLSNPLVWRVEFVRVEDGP